MGVAGEMGSRAGPGRFGEPPPDAGRPCRSPLLVREAIEATREGKGGFADHLVAQVGLLNGAKEILTFDAAFGKAAKVRRIK